MNKRECLDFGSEMRETVFMVRAGKNEKPKKIEGNLGRRRIRRSIVAVKTIAITKKTCCKIGTYCDGQLNAATTYILR